jgi:hypothetical protein
MNRRFSRRVPQLLTAVTAGVTLALAVQPALAGDPGDAGAKFLRVGMGARASAMGSAYVAVAEDASSVYWNPAAMAPVLNTNLLLMHNEYMQSVRLEQAAVTHETNYGTIGLSFTGMYMDKLELRDDNPSTMPLGEFSVYDVSFAVGFARYITPNLSLGATVKPVYEKIGNRSATGVAFDVGVYHVAYIDGLKLAAVVANVGMPMKFIDEEFALPRSFKIGTSYERETMRLRGRFLFALDAVFPNDGDPKQHIGGEYEYRRLLALRAGYMAGYDSKGETFGLGVRYKYIEVDYAFLLIRNDLGDSHRISLSFSL